MSPLHSPLCLLGELGPLHQFILLCHDDGFWKWSVDESHEASGGWWHVAMYNRWLGRGGWFTAAQALLDRPLRPATGFVWTNGLNLSETGTLCKLKIRPRAWGGPREACGGLTLCCLWVARALLDDFRLTYDGVCHSFCLHWLASAWDWDRASTPRTPLRKSKLVTHRG